MDLDSICFCLKLLGNSKINQKILVGPNDINTYPGETVQLPCIVSKQPDAIVTWCWNDFCTLGKTQLISNETTQDGHIRIYQYTAYPRFQLSINERLRTYQSKILFIRKFLLAVFFSISSGNFILLIIFFFLDSVY